MALNIKSIEMAELRDGNSYAPYIVCTYRAYTVHTQQYTVSELTLRSFQLYTIWPRH
jgi:hypothetical protein